MTQPLGEKACAELFKALADQTRLKILRTLFETPKCVSDLEAELRLTQSLVSHHLKTLKTAGLVESRRDGQKICYALHPQIKDTLSHTRREKLDLGCCEVTFRP